jgi:hypothetical protein
VILRLRWCGEMLEHLSNTRWIEVIQKFNPESDITLNNYCSSLHLRTPLNRVKIQLIQQTCYVRRVQKLGTAKAGCLLYIKGRLGHLRFLISKYVGWRM